MEFSRQKATAWYVNMELSKQSTGEELNFSETMKWADRFSLNKVDLNKNFYIDAGPGNFYSTKMYSTQ